MPILYIYKGEISKRTALSSMFYYYSLGAGKIFNHNVICLNNNLRIIENNFVITRVIISNNKFSNEYK